MLSYFPAGVEYGSQESAIGTIGTAIAPVFAPLGFGEWQPAVALAFGLVAKEVVVGTFSSLFGVAEEGAGIAAAMHGIFTPLTAYVFMVFVLLYIPCFCLRIKEFYSPCNNKSQFALSYVLNMR
jgi:ferrous iron transport protein B